MTENQNPEQKARDRIDALLEQAGWVVQHNKKIDFSRGIGIAVREYTTDKRTLNPMVGKGLLKTAFTSPKDPRQSYISANS